ncbi:MAG: phosphatase PAP2 family protein [Puia sp.]|nr:phosphatase PAP2 family protein [Puia sp.]
MPQKCWLLLLCLASTLHPAAQQDSVSAIFPKPVGKPAVKMEKEANKLTVCSFVLPSALIAYGVVALHNPSLQSLDRHIRQAVWLDRPHGQLPLDNYLQYAPGAAVYLFNVVGIQGKNNFRDRTIVYLAANAMMGITIEVLKHAIPAERPDGSGNDGFPSGHTGTAFVAAEFLRQEYEEVSPWYGIGGYAAAIATGYLRLYNDKHWFSELLPGAGIGILSTKAAYWIYPAIRRRLVRTKKAGDINRGRRDTGLVALPFYHSGTAGVSVDYFFH